MIAVIMIHGWVVHCLVAHLFNMLRIAGHAVEVQPPHVATQTHITLYGVRVFRST